MPAITSDLLDQLPSLESNTAEGAIRSVGAVTTAPHDFEGEGFPVRRAFAGVDLTDLDPFIHLDQMGPVNYAPGEAKGTPWHPHRGFETVTYMIDGVMQHTDSTGGGGRITDGDTQWMTAGRGILHIETPPPETVEAGGLFHGVQLWVNLPAVQKWIEPNYQQIDAGAITLLRSPDGGALVRLIAGAIDEHRGPGSTRTPMNLVHVSLQPGARVSIPWPATFNALLYVLEGEAGAGPERRPVHDGQLAVFGQGHSLTIEAGNAQASTTGELEALLLGGHPIDEPVAWYGPFVMNTQSEIDQAIADVRAGRLGTIPD